MYVIQYKPTETALAAIDIFEQRRVRKGDVVREEKGGQKPLRISK